MADLDDESDPIIANYPVFLKPALPPHRHLAILQYINTASANPANLVAPRVRALRVKPRGRMVEVDVPLDTAEVGYDRAKGMGWGAALARSLEARKGGSMGLAGGFGIGAPPLRPAGRRGGLHSDDEPLTWAEAARLDRVLRTQTLGGRSAEEGHTRTMVGVFQGSESWAPPPPSSLLPVPCQSHLHELTEAQENMHLTPVSSIVHLRPVQHHLDAATEQDRLSRTHAASQVSGTDGGHSGRAIHMTLKAAMEDDGLAAETIADRLRAVQTEGWQHMEYVHDEHEAAWEAYNENLLLRPTVHMHTSEVEKGKEAAGGADEADMKSLADQVARLQTDWDEDRYLRAISGIQAGDKSPGEEAASQHRPAPRPSRDKGKGKAPGLVKVEEPGAEPKKRGPGTDKAPTRGVGGGRGGGRGGRGRKSAAAS